MSLQNIKLPDVVIADLYKQTLVQDEGAVETYKKETAPEPVSAKPAEAPEPKTPAKPVEAQASQTGYKVLGKNAKQVAIVVNFASEAFLPEGELQFLTKMLGACKLNLADVAIVNHATTPIEIEKLKQQLLSRHVLLFGVEPSAIQLPISFPAFKEQAYAGTTYLFAPSLEQLNKETEEAKGFKKKLWECLKRTFV
jgi:hypothetical protein